MSEPKTIDDLNIGRVAPRTDLGHPDDVILVSKAQLIQLIEGIIGEDEERLDPTMPDDLLVTDWQARNALRADQRHRLEQASNNKKGERDE